MTDCAQINIKKNKITKFLKPPIYNIDYVTNYVSTLRTLNTLKQKLEINWTLTPEVSKNSGKTSARSTSLSEGERIGFERLLVTLVQIIYFTTFTNFLHISPFRFDIFKAKSLSYTQYSLQFSPKHHIFCTFLLHTYCSFFQTLLIIIWLKRCTFANFFESLGLSWPVMWKLQVIESKVPRKIHRFAQKVFH